MKENRFNFCPDCGSKKIQTLSNGRKWLCPECGFDLYNNVAAAVGVILVDKEGNVVFEKRAKEPKKGFLAFPGGFCEPDENAEESARRECLEEIGCKIKDLKYIGTFPNTYVYKDIIYKTCDMFFSAKLPETFEFKPQESEVLSLEMHRVDTLESIEILPLAFGSASLALKKFLELKKEERK